MGDRFVLVRADSTIGRLQAGAQALRNTGHETEMRGQLATVVGGLIQRVDPSSSYELAEEEQEKLLKAADIVTYARTAVERDHRGEIIEAHAPEMPTRFTKQLAQVVRGAVGIGMTPEDAMRLALRCARDSIPPLRRKILLDIAASPFSTAHAVHKRLSQPRPTVTREIQALDILGLLHSEGDPTMYRLVDTFDRETLLTFAGSATKLNGEAVRPEM